MALMKETAFQIEISRIAELRLAGIPIVNLTDGGEGASGFRRPSDIRLKISLSMKGKRVPGRILSAEHRAAIANSLRGRSLSQETRDKISAAQKGKPRPELIGRKLSINGLQRLRDRTFSEDHRKKISEGVRAAKKRNRLVQNAKIGQTFAAANNLSEP